MEFIIVTPIVTEITASQLIPGIALNIVLGLFLCKPHNVSETGIIIISVLKF